MNSENTKPVIFLAFANEREDEVRYLRNLAGEERNIRHALDFASRNGLCEIVERSNATLQDILDVFQDPLYSNRIAIFHYGGHSNGYQLLLESEKGLTTAAHAGGLAAFLGQQDGLQLVFLNGCATQKQAQGLNDAGISMVIATSCDIDDGVAMELASRFYNALGGGANIQRAYNEARAAIKAEHGDSPRNLYFAGCRAEDLVEDRWPWDLYLLPGAESAVQWSLQEAVGNPLFGLPPVPAQDLPPSPFRYLSWFEREHAEIFFGRGYEIRYLYQRATDPDSAPIILFYGQSGVGKTSVLAAGLLPRLERSYEIRYLRRESKKGLLVTLLEGLSEKQGMTLAESWLDRENQTEKPLVIILDQVEEAFTRPNPDLPHELPDFWNALQTTFGNPSLRPRGKLILGFRKEWLAETEKQLSDRKLPFSRVLLERLNRRGIIEAVSGTARSERLQQYYGLKVEDGLSEIIADDMLEDRESSVAPTLQILLTKMWEKAKERDHEHPVFDLDLYLTLKEKGILLQDFLDQQLVALEKWNSEIVNSGLALDVLEFHTTTLGTSEERTEEQLQQTYKHKSQVINPLIQQCVDLYLLERLSKAVTTRLYHDTLAPLVRQRFTASDKPGQRARRILESRSVDWQDDKQGVPLDEFDLSLVEKGENGMRAWGNAEERLVKASREKRAEIERTEKERAEWAEKERAEKERTRNYIIKGLVAGLTLIFFIAGFATYQWHLVEQQKQIAENKTKEASAMNLNIQSRNLSQDNSTLDKSILLAIESFRIYRTWAADQLIRQGLLLIPHSVVVLNNTDWVNNVMFSPDGKHVATASNDNKARLWDAATGKQILVLKHDGPVYNVVFSPDGKYVATASADNTARLWDAVTGKQIFVLNHNDTEDHIVFSPDGKHIATASKDNTSRLWDAATGKQIFVLKHDWWVQNVVFSPDGKYIATASRDNTSRLWDAATGKQIFVLEHNGSVDNVIFSPNGKYVATASFDKTARVWDAATGKQIFVLNHDNPVNNVVFSPNGKYIATKNTDTARVWDAATGKPIYVLNHYMVNNVVFSPDGKYIVTASHDKTARVWDAATGKQVFVLNHDSWVFNAVFSPDGKYVATVSLGNTTRLWDVATVKQIILNHEGPVKNVVFSPDGKYIATASDDKTARVWDASTGKQIFVLNHTDEVRNVVFSPDGKYIVTASDDKTARVWDAATGKQIFVLNHDDWVYSVAFSPDGKYVATASRDNTARLWDAATGKPIYVLNHDSTVDNVIFSPDGKYVATATQETAYLWDAATGKQIFVLNHDGWVNNVVFSPDGKYIAMASSNNKACLWDASTGKQVFVLNHDGSVDNVVFSPDGKYIATASNDNTARLWDAATGKQILVLYHDSWVSNVVFSSDERYVATTSGDTARLWDASTGKQILVLNHYSLINNVLFSPDEKYVATASDDNTSILWICNTEDLINEASNSLARNLNREEWNMYVGDEPYHKTFSNLP